MKRNHAVQELLFWGVERLKKFVLTPQLDAEVLLAFVLKTSREKLFINPRQQASLNKVKTYRSLVVRRCKGEPVAYLIRKKEFYGRSFYVDERVLIPRPQTELIIDEIIKFTDKHSLVHPKILDIGTGSGCLAATLKCEIKKANVVAVDVSPHALAVAKKNFRKLGVKIPLYQSDLFSCLPIKFKNSFHIIISNPPYLHSSEKVNYDTIKATKLFEPREALCSRHNNHLFFYRKILRQSRDWLFVDRSTLVILEIPSHSKKILIDLAAKNFSTSKIATMQDLENYDRILTICTN